MMNIVYIAMGVAGLFVFLMLTLIVLCFMLIRKLNRCTTSELEMTLSVEKPVAKSASKSDSKSEEVPEKRKSRLGHLLPSA